MLFRVPLTHLDYWLAFFRKFPRHYTCSRTTITKEALMKKCNLIQNQPIPRQSCKEPLNPRTYTQNHTPHQGTRGGQMEPSPEFLICCSVSKRFCLHWKAFDLLNKMRYILRKVALLEACDVTNNGRHLGRHLGFYQELEIRLKQREMVIAWHE